MGIYINFGHLIIQRAVEWKTCLIDSEKQHFYFLLTKQEDSGDRVVGSIVH